MRASTHPSFDRLASALHDFAAREKPGAMLLRGAWGVGKTYACLDALKARDPRSQIPFSYVSLYGISNLDEIYTRIALGWINKISSKAPKWTGEIADNGKKLVTALSTLSSTAGKAAAIGTAAMGLMARKTLVVLDDLERRDSALSIHAALGVASYLVESRECRVIFISNDDVLEGDDRQTFDRHKEKVFDYEHLYAPTVAENVSLISKANAPLLLPVFEALKLTNIRVIRRVNELLDVFRSRLDARNTRANEVVMRNVALLGALHHGCRGVVDLESRKRVVEAQIFLHDEKLQETVSESDRIFIKVAFSASPADNEIAEFLSTNFIDWTELNNKLSDQELFFKSEAAKREFLSAIDLVRDNFVATTDQAINALETVCEQKAELISPMSLEWGGEILKKLGRPDRSQEWLERWKQANVGRITSDDIEHVLSGFVSWPKRILPAIRAESIRRKGVPDLQKTLHDRFESQSWSPEHMEQLAKRPAKDYDEWLLSSSPALGYTVRQVLREFANSSGPEGKLFGKTVAALNRLSKRSPIDKYRVESFKRLIPKTRAKSKAKPPR